MSLNNIMTREVTQHYVSNQNGRTIMKSEMENVIKEIKCGKASGNDAIATEMTKALDDEGITKITELCNLVYDTLYLPPDMSSSIFVTLPKKVKATECSYYRTLSLMSHLFKILLKVILKRNKHKIESVISETQRGFSMVLGPEMVPGKEFTIWEQ